MTRNRTFVMFAVFVVGVAFWSVSGSMGQIKTDPGKAVVGGGLPPLPTWEYKIVDVPVDNAEAERELNKLGVDRWELVTAPGDVYTPAAGGAIRTKTRAVLKRQK
jgi:hypothetical protein